MGPDFYLPDRAHPACPIPRSQLRADSVTCELMNPPETQREGESQVVFSEEEGIRAEQKKETDVPTVPGVTWSIT